MMKLKPVSFAAIFLAAFFTQSAIAANSNTKTAVGGGVGAAAGTAIGTIMGGTAGGIVGGAVGGAAGSVVTTQGQPKTGAVIGGATGGALGAIVGRGLGGGAAGAVIGAGAGGAGGAVIGKKLSEKSPTHSASARHHPVHAQQKVKYAGKKRHTYLVKRQQHLTAQAKAQRLLAKQG